MRYDANRRETAQFLMSGTLRRVCALAAGKVLAKARVLAASGPYATGATAATGRLVHKTGGSKNDRVVVSVTFSGHAVPMQFGNDRVQANRFLTRALE